MWGRAAFLVSMVVIAGCVRAIEAGGVWLVVGVIVLIPATVVWLGGFVIGLLDLLGDRN